MKEITLIIKSFFSITALFTGLINTISTLFLLKFYEIKNYFYPMVEFTEEEIKTYPIEFQLNNELIGILNKKITANNIKHINLDKIFSYIRIYYNDNLSISFNYPLKNYKIDVLYMIFSSTISSIYLLRKYFKLKKSNNFKERHKHFDMIYMEKNLPIIQIYMIWGFFVSLIRNTFNISFVFFLLCFVVYIFIIKLYKHYMFIEDLKTINFMERDGVLYINKYDLNKFLYVVNCF